MKDCTTCKYGFVDEQLGFPMCHHPSRLSEDCVDFNKHQEQEEPEKATGIEEKELPESPDFEAEWKRYTASRKDDMRANAVTMNVKEVALYFAKWGRRQVLTAKPSEELEEEIHRYFDELEKSDCVSNTRRLAKHFAEWGAENLKSNH